MSQDTGAPITDDLIREMLHAAPDAMLLVDREGRIVVANAQVLDLFGYQPEELVGLSVDQLVPEARRGGHHQHRAAFFAQPVTRPMRAGNRLSGQRRDGSEIPVEISLSPVHQGRYVCCAIRDVTEQRAAERALAASERQLAEAQEIAHLGHWDWILATDAVHWSNELCRIFGVEPDSQLEFDSYAQCIHPEDLPKVKALVDRALSDGRDFQYTHRMIRMDGVQRQLEVRAHVVLGEDGKPCRMFGTAQDVSEQQRREALLTQNQQRLQLLHMVAASMAGGLDAMDQIEYTVMLLSEAFPDARASYMVLEDDSQGRYVHTRGPEQMVDLSGNSLDLSQAPGFIGKLKQREPITVSDVREESTLVEIQPCLQAANIAACLDIPIRLACGAIGVLALHADRPRQWRAHEVDTLMAVGRQLGVALSEVYRREQANQAHAQLEAQARDLQRSNHDLERFAYVASHDLREPLRTVGSYAQLLQRRYGEQLDESGGEFIEFMVDAVNRMQGLIQDLLGYSRAGRAERPLQAVALQPVVSDILRDLGQVIEETGVQIECGELPEVQADPGQITQVLQNLIGNAIKFRGEQAPKVLIDAQADGDDWIIRVRDNGIGIDPEQRERVFEIFQRLHTHDAYPGTGIGLAICKKIIERHGGDIWVEGAEPGSRFCCRLARAKKPMDAAA